MMIQFDLPQGATKVLSDSPGPVNWLVGLAFSYRMNNETPQEQQKTDKPFF